MLYWADRMAIASAASVCRMLWGLIMRSGHPFLVWVTVQRDRVLGDRCGLRSDLLRDDSVSDGLVSSHHMTSVSRSRGKCDDTANGRLV